MLISRLLSNTYIRLVASLIRFCVAWCRARERVVQYEIRARCKHHGEYGSLCPCGACLGYETSDVYMTRYVLFGHMTGDKGWGGGWKRFLPSVYINCIHRPDHDEAVHNHPWPWAITFGLLGGYYEKRALAFGPSSGAPVISERIHRRNSPFFYVLKRKHWHRITDVHSTWCISGKSWPACEADGKHVHAVWTLFVAAPRVFSKPWGYIVKGRGYVDQRERHAEIGALETRPTFMVLPAQGKHLDRVAEMYGLRRKRYAWVLRESDKRLRARCIDLCQGARKPTLCAWRYIDKAPYDHNCPGVLPEVTR